MRIIDQKRRRRSALHITTGTWPRLGRHSFDDGYDIGDGISASMSNDLAPDDTAPRPNVAAAKELSRRP